MPKTKRWFRDFKEVQWGCHVVEAETADEAQKLFDEGDHGDFINKSEQTVTSKWHE